MALFAKLFGVEKGYADAGSRLTYELIQRFGLEGWPDGRFPVYSSEEAGAIDLELSSFQRSADGMAEEEGGPGATMGFHPEALPQLRRHLTSGALVRLADENWMQRSDAELRRIWKQCASTYLKAWLSDLDPSALLRMAELLSRVGCKREARKALEAVLLFPSYVDNGKNTTGSPPDFVASVVKDAQESIRKLRDSERSSQGDEFGQRAEADLDRFSEAIALVIGSSFSTDTFRDLFGEREMAEGWTWNDAVAAWYSLGHFALVIAAWSVYANNARTAPVLDCCRPKLLEHWNLSPNGAISAKLKKIVNEIDSEAFASYVRCKDGTLLHRFFARYVSRILGAPVPFSERNVSEDELLGIRYRGEDPILHATVCRLFLDTCAEIKKLISSR